MTNITNKEFEKIYENQIKPDLFSLENNRIITLNKDKIIRYILILLGTFYTIYLMINKPEYTEHPFLLGVITTVIFIVIAHVLITMKIKKQIKTEIFPKILEIFGNLQISKEKNIITLQEIQSFGLFLDARDIHTDDVIVEIDKKYGLAIIETTLSHTKKQSDNSSTRIKDFEGLIVKVEMKKKFSGKTIVGKKYQITQMPKCKEVKLESVEFMKRRTVYSTDQIEARYILTPALMDRLQNLPKFFIHTNSETSVAFIDNFAYLFIPSSRDFFEISIYETLINPEQYYNIYREIKGILSIIEYLHLDKDAGL